MALPVFVPIVEPSPGTSLSPEVSLHEVSFGDGYTLAAPAGLNHIRMRLTLKWDGLSKSEHDALRAFFEARKGYEPFLYTHPSDGVQRKWTCKSWSSTLGVPFKFTADLVESFAPVS